MAPYDTISPIASVSEIAPPTPVVAISDAPPPVVSNDPITAARLIASIPANLGQNVDFSA